MRYRRYWFARSPSSRPPGAVTSTPSTAPFPGTILYQDPQGAFEFRLLQPPWIPPFVLTYQDLRLTFSVVPPPDATVTADPNVLLAQALYSLQFSQVTGDPVAAMAEVKGSIPGGSSAASGRVDAATGTTGVEMTWQENRGRVSSRRVPGGDGHADVPAALHRPERSPRIRWSAR